MESLADKSKSTKGFIKYLFNFDEETKSNLLNIIQYTLLAYIPVILLNKGIQRFIPDVDDEKGSLEILAEILTQLLVMFIGLFFINRIVTYIPTYSGFDYPVFETIYSILAIIMFIVSLQTKIGEKTNIIIDRIMELWDGKMGNKKDDNKGKKTKNTNSSSNVKVSQPISQNMASTSQNQNSSNSYSDGTSIGQLPNYNTPQQSSPDFNNMYQKDPTPLVGAATPGEGFETGGIMAANEVLGGGGSFASW